MPIDIQGFKGSFTDLARANLFEVSLGGISKLEFHCKAASIPSSTISPIAVPFSGRQIKIPGDRTYDDWNITVLLDDTFSARDEIYAWMDEINNTTSNVSQPPESVKRDGTIKALRRDGGTATTYKIVGAWPTNVGTVEFSQDSTDTIAELPLVIAFDWFEKA